MYEWSQKIEMLEATGAEVHEIIYSQISSIASDELTLAADHEI